MVTSRFWPKVSPSPETFEKGPIRRIVLSAIRIEGLRLNGDRDLADGCR